MALPSNLNYGTVVGQFLVAAADGPDADTLPDQVPASGTVTFSPSAGVILDYESQSNPYAVLKKKIICTLDSEGFLLGPDGERGVSLIATDNEGVKPEGWQWIAIYDLKDDEGKPLRSLVKQPFLVPSNTTVDLVDVLPIEESEGVLLSRGEVGPVGPQGPQGPQGIQGIRGGRWFYSKPEHVDYFNVPSPIEGDIFLYPESRDFFQYKDGEWAYSGVIGAIKGDTGPANTLTIGTVSSGTEASATITGSAPNQILNLTVPVMSPESQALALAYAIVL